MVKIMCKDKYGIDVSGDIEYRYKVSIPSEVKSNNDEEEVPSGMAGANQTETVYESGRVQANTTLHMLIEGLTDPTVYAVSVWAVNVQINKSSEPVTVFADLTLTGSLTLVLLNPDLSVFENTVDLGSTLFSTLLLNTVKPVLSGHSNLS